VNDGVELERIVTDWLRAGAPTRAPETVLAGALDRVDGARQERPFGGRRLDDWIGRPPRLRTRFVALLAMVAILALLGAAVAFVGSQRQVQPPSGVVANGWIAYSTSSQLPGSTDIRIGSAIYLVRAGEEPRWIAGYVAHELRADNVVPPDVRAVCPAFSSDGRRLAFGEAMDQGRFIVVLSVDPNGVTSDPVYIRVAGPGPAVCVLWSSDGTRVGYLDGATVVMRGLDGSTPASVAGDPRRVDFELGTLASPEGDRVVSRSAVDCQITIANRDGTGAHAISPSPGFCPYAIPAWSPDGRQILVMQDIGGAVAMDSIPVDDPVDMATVVSNVAVNGERSWPGRGDVSWQPLFP
jgi:hypothetical protein